MMIPVINKVSDKKGEFELFLFSEILVKNREKLRESESFVLTLQKEKGTSESVKKRVNVKKIVSIEEMLNEPYSKVTIEGNRKRKNLDDPDKVLADLYGTQYGLRESFLSYVYPDRSLGRLIPADLKAAFTDLYKKELEMALLDYKGLSIGPASLDKIRAEVAQDVLKSFPDVDTRFVLEQMTVASDKAFLKDVVDEATGEAK